MKSDKALVLPEVPLPAKASDLIDYRLHAKPSLPDELERACRQFYEQDGFRALMKAKRDEEAIEGSIYDDDTEACRLLREWAKKAGNYMVLPGTPIKKVRACFRRSTTGRRLLDLSRKRRLEQALLAASQAYHEPEPAAPSIPDVGE